ncbi:MAG: ferrous iron transport protein A [Chitinispirillaceae bacterium]
MAEKIAQNSLANCREGEVLIIERIDGRGALKKRLLEMGLVPGSIIEIVKYAPLMDPMEVVTRGARMSLRVSEAMRIIVTPDGITPGEERSGK